MWRRLPNLPYRGLPSLHVWFRLERAGLPVQRARGFDERDSRGDAWREEEDDDVEEDDELDVVDAFACVFPLEPPPPDRDDERVVDDFVCAGASGRGREVVVPCRSGRAVCCAGFVVVCLESLVV